MPEFIAMLGSAPGPKSLGQTPTYSYMGRMPDFSYQSIAREGDLRGLGNFPYQVTFPDFLRGQSTTGFKEVEFVRSTVNEAYKLVREYGASNTAISALVGMLSDPNKSKAFAAWALLWMKSRNREADIAELAMVKEPDNFAKAVLDQYYKFVPVLGVQLQSAANLAAIAAKRSNDNIYTTAADLSCAIRQCADLHFGAFFAAAMGADRGLNAATSRRDSIDRFIAPMTFDIDGYLIPQLPDAYFHVVPPIFLPHYVDLAAKILGTVVFGGVIIGILRD
jgi:hypothetical protein